jgi:hypothetical protein
MNNQPAGAPFVRDPGGGFYVVYLLRFLVGTLSSNCALPLTARVAGVAVPTPVYEVYSITMQIYAYKQVLHSFFIRLIIPQE